MNLTKDYQQAGNLAREVVAVRVPVLTGLGVITGLLVQQGVIPDGLANDVTHRAAVAFTVLGVVAGVLWARKGTTPANPSLNPKDSYGNRLVSDLAIGPHAGMTASSPVAAEVAFAAAAAIQQPLNGGLQTSPGTGEPMTAVDVPVGGTGVLEQHADSIIGPTAHSDTTAP